MKLFEVKYHYLYRDGEKGNSYALVSAASATAARQIVCRMNADLEILRMTIKPSKGRR